MGLVVKLLGCSPGMCAGCYENSLNRSTKLEPYDLQVMLRIIEAEGKKEPKNSRCNAPTLHGGEPLLIPMGDMKKLFSLIYKYWGSTGIQTNGVLLTDEHVELFEKYKTNVGISIDGDTAELNFGRWNARPLAESKIQDETDKVVNSIGKCRSAGLRVSMISLLRWYNVGTPDKLSKFKDFLLRMYREFGIVDVRTNPVIDFVGGGSVEEQLTTKRLSEVFIELADTAFSNPELNWQPYRDVVNLLFGYGQATCVFNKCDPWKTVAESPMFGDGSIGNCLKTPAAQDGLCIPALENFSFDREMVLKQISMDEDGCKDCKYWLMCYGGCVGEGFDWRGRTRFCESFKQLFAHTENRLKGIIPNLLLLPDFSPDKITVEHVLKSISVSSWTKGGRKSVKDILGQSGGAGVKSAVGGMCGESGGGGHGDRHGDHMDRHGDHTDAQGRS